MTTALASGPAARFGPAVVLPQPWCDAPVAVVVPTYNEVDNLPQLLERLFALKLSRLRVIIVDDNSPDGTGDLADRLAAEYNAERPDRMLVVHRTAKEGIGKAHLAGMAEAMAHDDEFIIQMDADLSHPPEFIPQMLGTMLSTDAGLIIGSRYVASGSLSSNWALYRRMLSRGGSAYVNTVLRLRIADTTAGYKLWRADSLKSIDLAHVRSTGFSFQIEMNYRALLAGVKTVEVPIHFDDRLTGQSKITLGIQLEGLWVPLALRFQRRPR
ncbi:polyprenol monophosphomannose synthase [Hamadaea tsunoensis]|uniref:polyprenol monophosphomannose synthase n=1 Tax=Hamadaea tsunoensis TaxID=53368 RepID=UPI0004026B3C|nr:polyprenol monophosphomannose synthase [Hamadaea tsunoensis]